MLYKNLTYSFLPRAISIITGPLIISLLTKNLSVQAYGLWTTLFSFGFLITAIASLGLQKVLSILIPGKKKNLQVKYLRNILIFEVFVYLTIASIIYSILKIFDLSLVEINSNELSLFFLAFLFNLIFSEIGRFFNYTGNISLRITLTCIEKILEITVLFSIFYTFNELNIIILSFSYLLIFFLIFILHLYFYFKKFSFSSLSLNLKLIQIGLKIGIPFFFTDLIWRLFTQIDQYLMIYFEKNFELGLYNYTFKITNFVYLLGSTVIWIIYPYLAKSFNQRKKLKFKIFLKVQYFFSNIISLNVSLILIIFWNFLTILIANEQYIFKQNFLLILIFNSLLLINLYISQQELVLNKMVKEILFSYFIGLLFNFIFDLILIPKYGSIGAALSSNLGLLVIIVSQFIYSLNKKYLINSILIIFSFMLINFIFINFNISIKIFFFLFSLISLIYLIFYRDKIIRVLSLKF